jgi:hypothetical protein
MVEPKACRLGKGRPNLSKRGFSAVWAPFLTPGRFASLTATSCGGEDGWHGYGAMKEARGTWFFLVVGAAIGLALGILVSVTTDVPLAPEAGLVLGALVGWLSRRVST